MNTRKAFFAFILIALFWAGGSAQPSISKVEPPSWWAGHSINPVRLLIRGGNFHGAKATSKNPAFRISNPRVNEKGDYLFLDLSIPKAAKPGKYEFDVASAQGKTSFNFEILPPLDQKKNFQGITSDDIIYLIMTDRFANGDPSNDVGPDRANPRMWHGGDFRGVINKLGYLKELGITAIWLTPWYDNSDETTTCDKPWCPMASYHGYGAVDYYGVENHFGSMADLRELIEKAHAKGIKVIQDQVANHIGFKHPWMKAPPLENWFSPFTQNRFNNSSLLSPNASKEEKENTLKGWFDFSLPDMNHEEPETAKYQTQNALWWIGVTGIDGIRQDTIQYMPRWYIRDWSKAIRKQYPKFWMVGEVFEEDSAQTSFFQGGKKGWDGIDTELPSVFDFKLWRTSQEVFTGKKPMRALRDVLKYDGLYPNINSVTTLANNHDTDRFMSLPGATLEGAKLHIAFILATRGIPQLYAGEEIAMRGGHDPDNRKDFPGGWKEDNRNAFTKEGRTAEEQEMFEWTRRWLAARKEHKAIREGQTIDVFYNENIYAFRRVKDADDLVFIFNSSRKSETISFDRKSVNAVDKGCYSDILPDLKTGLSSGRCPDAGSNMIDFTLGPMSVTAVSFGNIMATQPKK